jgi:hypothetical protein
MVPIPSFKPPDIRQALGFDEIDLLGEAQAVHRHQRIMAGIGGAAQRVLHDQDAEADIHGIQHSREHTDVGLGARDDDGANLFFEQLIDQWRAEESRVCRLVDDRGRRRVARQFGDKIELRRAERLARGDFPTLEIRPPLAGCLVRRERRDESAENRSRRIARGNVGDRWKHPLHPGRFPNPAFCEDELHVDAEVDGILDRPHRSRRSSR